MNKVRIGIVGMGIGRTHAKNLARARLGELTAVCDLDAVRLAAATDEFRVPGFATVDAMLDAAAPQAVLVCTPPYVRQAVIEPIVSRGIPVFVEKPPARELAAARDVIALIDRAGVVNAVGFMYRWMRAADRARELIADRPVLVCQITGLWGVLYWARDGAVSPDYFRRDRAGGPMVEQGVHLIDVARYVMGDEVVRVNAPGRTSSCRGPSSSPPRKRSRRQWRGGGAVGSHVHSWVHGGHVFQVLFAGADFAFVLDLKENRLSGWAGGDHHIDERFDDDCYVTELDGFCAAVQAGDPALIRGNYADACRTLAVAETMMRSIDVGADLAVPEV